MRIGVNISKKEIIDLGAIDLDATITEIVVNEINAKVIREGKVKMQLNIRDERQEHTQ